VSGLCWPFIPGSLQCSLPVILGCSHASPLDLSHLLLFSALLTLTTLMPPSALALRLGGYEMHDLVVLDNTTVGVVVNVDQDSLRVLTNQASKRAGAAHACALLC
jgi:ABC-type sugar transport system substrate-binding protein